MINKHIKTTLISKLLSSWIILDMLCILSISKYAYSFDLGLKLASHDVLVQTVSLLPKSIYLSLKTNGWILAFSVILASLFVLMFNKSLLCRFLQLILFNLHYSFAYTISSGATTLVACSLSYLFLIELSKKVEKWNTNFSFLYDIFLISFKLQVAIIYLISGLAKWNSDLWRSGAATYYILNNDRYSKIDLVVEIINSNMYLTKIITYSCMVFLIIFPLAIWTRAKKPLLILSLCFHSFIAIFMGLREFMIFPVLDFFLFADDKLIAEIVRVGRKIKKWAVYKQKNCFPIGIKQFLMKLKTKS